MMKTTKSIHSLDTVFVEGWFVRVSMLNGFILVVMLNFITTETKLGFFENEKDANNFVNNLCYHTE